VVNKKTRLRVYIFFDFWNFQLGLNNFAKENFPVDWEKLPYAIFEEVKKLLPDDTVFLDEIRIYISYDPNSESDKNLLRWANGWLSTRPRFKVILKERKLQRKHPFCSNCRREIKECPYCNSPLKGTNEKGIDTSIVTDIIKLAWNDAYDVSIIVSSDADFIPAVEFLGERGKKVIAAGFPPLGKELRQSCWAQIDLGTIKSKFRRKDR